MLIFTKTTSMTRALYSILTLLFFQSSFLMSQKIFTGIDAHEKIPGTILIREGTITDIPSFIKFQKGKEVANDHIFVWLSKLYSVGESTFDLINQSTDKLGYTHYRYQQVYNGHPIERAVIILHTKNGKVESLNGQLFTDANINESVAGSEENALNAALKHVDAATYKWEINAEEAHIKIEENNPLATYYPHGELVYIQENNRSPQVKLAYKFNIYAHQPVSRAWIYVDAATNQIIFEDKIIKHVDVIGTATTAYSGSQSITADSFNGSYRLRESGRGNGVETYDMGQGTSYGSAVDFTDSDNNWTTTNPALDEYATDAHWGAEMTYDYFWLQHGRNSIDGAGFALKSYVHYDNNFVNAFWDGSRMTYGDGNGGTITPLTSVDIAGHEVSHGLTTFTANLIYQDESGALNESFSDIFGTCIENYARPSNWNWTIGEDIGTTLRSMSNPNQYSDPDTYFGNNWQPLGGPDNGGVHSNSGVQNYWFYLLTIGGNGTNDNGDGYNVTGQGFVTAGQIAFRNLTVYLTPSSNFHDARFYAILSAIDLFGPCTPEVEATTDAWYAVGVGNPYVSTVDADFSAVDSMFCSYPAQVNFLNLSSNGVTYTWDFGDNSTSTGLQPIHLYNNFGSYDVKLIADGGACGIDSITKPNFIQIDSLIPCVFALPNNGLAPDQTGCSGTLYDSGGPFSNYGDLQDAVVTIDPLGADSVKITFVSFDIEPGNGPSCNYDFLKVYDGTSTSAPLIGSYCNNYPPPASITSSGSAITIEFHSDQSLTLGGFEIDWQCYISTFPPIADFESADTVNCTGEVQFTDLSANSPTNWTWDFGDNTTSNAQNPLHTYQNSGLYTVKLITSNSVGIDSVTFTDYVNVDLVSLPTPTGDLICENQTAELSTTGTGVGRWYDGPNSTVILQTGNSFTTPVLTGPASYYVSNYEPGDPFSVGPASSAIGSGAYFSSYQYLIFNCFEECLLKTVRVEAGNDGVRTIELRNSSGAVLASRSVYITSGTNVITLDFEIPVGSNLQLGNASGTSPSLFRNSTGVSFPYSSANGMIDITGNSSGSTNYSYFYDWNLEEIGCESDRVAVSVDVLPDFNVNLIIPEYSCVYENTVQFAASMAGGTWSADCNNCIDPVSGVFQPGNAGEGTWNISYTVTNQCEKTFTESIDVESCLSISDPEVREISIYPNPGKAVVNLIYPEKTIGRITISDISGKIISELTPSSDQMQFDFSPYAKGVYFVSFKDMSGKRIETKKFIKQ